jgi:hypothetical protein
MGATMWRTPGFEINDLGYIQEADEVLSVLWQVTMNGNRKGFTEITISMQISGPHIISEDNG